jgi:hypothetical protein
MNDEPRREPIFQRGGAIRLLAYVAFLAVILLLGGVLWTFLDGVIPR